MFQSDDDITFDAEFLSDTFELASSATSVECSKRPSEATEPESVKKLCTSSQNTLDILSLLKSNAEKPSENRSEHRFARPVLPSKKRRVVQRRFPGPAGILPAQRDVNVDLNKLENEKDEKSDSDELVCSQHSEDVFTRPAWRRMLQDLESLPGDLSPDVGLPERYTIAWAKARAARRQLVGGRTPFLAAVVQQIDCSTRNPMAVLKDQTGEIQATLIHELWEEYGEQLHTGAVILLRQVGVLSTAKQHYLAVTVNNLFAIYSDETPLTSNSPAVTKVNYMTSSDFIQTLADIRNRETWRENDSNSAGLFSNALNDSGESRRDTRMRGDDETNRAGLYSNAECSRNSAARRNINSLELFSTAEVPCKQLRSDSVTRRDTQSGATNAPGLFSTAEPSCKQLRSDSVTRRDTQSGATNAPGLFSSAEVSYKQPRSDSVTRRDTLPRRDTHSGPTNAPGLFSTADLSCKQPRSDSQPRRDTLPRSNTHTRPTNAPGLFSSANFTTDSRADSTISDTPTFLRADFHKNTEKSSQLSQESEMLSQILDGLDADSIFDDF